MKKHEFVTQLLIALQTKYPYIEYNSTYSTIEEILNGYEISPSQNFLVPTNNFAQHTIYFLASKRIEGLSRTTLYSYSLYLKKLMHFCPKDIENFTAMDIRMFLADYSNNGAANSTIASITWILKSFFKWLFVEDYITKNPMDKIKTIKVEQKLKQPLSLEEVEMIRDSCQTLRQRALFEVFYSTGCRLAEVEQLQKSSIDWSGMSAKVLGKGSKERIIFINSSAKVHLKKYLASRDDSHPALFITERNPIRMLGGRAIQREVDKMGALAELGQKLHPHLIRHTMATHLVNCGADLHVVQKLLGHSNPATTQQYGQLALNNVEHEYRKYFM